MYLLVNCVGYLGVYDHIKPHEYKTTCVSCPSQSQRATCVCSQDCEVKPHILILHHFSSCATHVITVQHLCLYGRLK